MRISDWSSDVCSSDLKHRAGGAAARFGALAPDADILFADIEHARLVVGDTAFDLAFERQLADQFYADLARLRRNQFQLAHLAVTLVDESIGPVRPAAAIQAQPIGVVEPGRLKPVGDDGQTTRRGSERIDRDVFGRAV